MSACATALIVIATILGPITLVFMAVSFGTDYWLEFNVDRTKLNPEDKDDKMARYTHTRYRGLFRECYPGNDTACKYRTIRTPVPEQLLLTSAISVSGWNVTQLEKERDVTEGLKLPSRINNDPESVTMGAGYKGKQARRSGSVFVWTRSSISTGETGEVFWGERGLTASVEVWKGGV
ncbi:hypothetical protein BaRGS_00006667 [Batillaria attramentaria]|uniref:Uncharacterized protein n=1 Tax=Batillaria attramentaria TaxID=370345 RepID=A0ABD0LRL8_9CAEN